MVAGPDLCTFMQYSITFLHPTEVGSDIIYATFWMQVVLDDTVKFGYPGLHRY